MSRIVYQSNTHTETIRPMADGEAPLVADLLWQALRDHAATENKPELASQGYWLAKVSNAGYFGGGVLVYTVNGNITGAAVAMANARLGHMELLGAATMTEQARTLPALLDEARAAAAAAGLLLVRQVLRFEPV